MDSVTVVPGADGVRLVQGTRALHIKGSEALLQRVVEQLRTGVGESELDAAPPASAKLNALAGELRSLGWLTDNPPGPAEAHTATERQLGYLFVFGPDALQMQARLEAARVAILGVGGVGTVVAQHLVGAGVRRLWLMDFDKVARHNLNRQFLFRYEDIGAPKAAAAADALQRLDPEVDARAIDMVVREPADLSVLPPEIDLLVIAADTPRDIADIVWQWGKERSVPIHMAAVGLESGYWGPLLAPESGHCWPCFDSGRRASLPAGQSALEDAGTAPSPYSFGPTNTVISALLAHDVIEYLATGHCASENRRGQLALQGARIEFLEGKPCACS
ncbi:ThiF family adenylyltransferase [Streptomyces sp. AM2-3-1]|uniref:ThiF family adenylyltransferase n=1 Tax=Streptomyces sp. AM2-3-1 TaxID=3075824 RepID=UPI0028C429B3|nr:ThiF family adenylyltransferase [Streptomyces sp. AM2-3-1]WNO67449.1 ThiF family adenylyltransferase [Streptomyces sp. AM2-3-1]